MNTATKTPARIVSIDFTRKLRPRLRLIEGEHGLYEMPGFAGYYARPRCNGTQREIKLKSSTLSKARDELGELRRKIERFASNVGPDPFKRSDKKSIADICEFYIS